MKPKTKEMHWRDERNNNGTKQALLNRVKFHGGINILEASKLMGLSIQTIRKHIIKLEEENRVVFHREEGRVRYNTI